MADIDKGLYEAPKGMEELGEQETAIEIEIEDPEEVNIKIGGMEITLILIVCLKMSFQPTLQKNSQNNT